MRLATAKERVLVIPDLQAPFHHQDAIPFLKAIEKETRPTKIVCIGDSIDAYALGGYVKKPEAMDASSEMDEALKFLSQLYKAFPKVVEVDSNHNRRVFRRAFEAGIPKRFLKSYGEFLNSPWEYVEDIEIDGILYEHGENVSGVTPHRMAALNNMKSTVIGHHHSTAGIQYIATKERMIFGMNVGCLIDLESYAFEYNKDYRLKPTLAAGVVVEGIPRLFPMRLNGKGRWDGTLGV